MTVKKTTASPEAAAAAAAEEAIKKRAARQAAKRELAPSTHPFVECVVLPQGDGKISMGEHVGGLGTAHYEEGETFTVALPIALALYRRGYVNFEGAKAALAEAQAAEVEQAKADQVERAIQQRAMEAAGL